MPTPILPEHPARTLEVEAGADAAGVRLDKWLAEALPDLSRSRIRTLMEEGRLSLDGARLLDPRTPVQPGGVYQLSLPEPAPAAPLPEPMPLDILHEDAHIIVLVKPAGVVVHPAPGAWTGTLVNALLHHCGPELTGIGGVARPGIVHRLDKDTSGVMVVAKTEAAHTALSAMFAEHTIERAYLAATRGAPRPLLGRIETRIARSSSDRKKMAVVRPSRISPRRAADLEFEDDPDLERGRLAVTNYRTLETFGRLDASSSLPAAALVECRLETGRTHQIRVHLAHIGAPVLGDPVYGKARGVKAHGAGEAHKAALSAARAFDRQALHAAVLGFDHPITGEPMRFEAPAPVDLQGLLAALRTLPA